MKGKARRHECTADAIIHYCLFEMMAYFVNKSCDLIRVVYRQVALLSAFEGLE
jgi:hypothetical protein